MCFSSRCRADGTPFISSTPSSSESNITVEFCNQTCTSSPGNNSCSEGCFCVFLNKETTGQCMSVNGAEDYPSDEDGISLDATPKPREE